MSETEKTPCAFNWRCPRCGAEGYAEDDRTWEFCHFCGARLVIEMPEEEGDVHEG